MIGMTVAPMYSPCFLIVFFSLSGPLTDGQG
jgi:hypothetical protein